jgi:hypothetical protein
MRQTELVGISRGKVCYFARTASDADLRTMQRMGIQALNRRPITSKLHSTTRSVRTRGAS